MIIKYKNIYKTILNFIKIIFIEFKHIKTINYGNKNEF